MTKQFNILYLLLLMIGSIACGDDEDQVITDVPSSDQYSTAEAFLQAQDFRGSVLIQKNGQDVIRKGYGMADASSGTPNDVSKVYRIGSMTKSLTAAGIVHLQRDGLIDSYDQPISDFVDDFPLGDQITLRHLLTHYSGLPDYVGAIEDAVINQNMFITPEDILDIIAESVAEDGTLFTPGAQFSYSNSNYLLLGLLIEELTEMSYHDYLQEKVFTPLGMASTGLGADDITLDTHAKGYKGESVVAPYPMQIAFSAGDLESTITDMEIWAKALMGDYFTTDEKAEVFAAPYGQDDVNTLGFGWFTIKVDGKLMYHHGGDIDGFTSLIALLPESQGMVILLSNEQDKGEQRNLIIETLAKYEF